MSASSDISQFLRSLDAQVKPRAVAAAKRGLAMAAAHVIGDSQELAPVDTGALKASGTAGEVQEDGDRLSVQIGHNTSYAAAVHERLDQRHTQGQAKYLETAVRNNIDKVPAIVAGEVKRAL